jgi:hypothetical protein
MYSAEHTYNVKLEKAWREYIDALEDHTIPYSRVVELRSVYEDLLNAT